MSFVYIERSIILCVSAYLGGSTILEVPLYIESTSLTEVDTCRNDGI